MLFSLSLLLLSFGASKAESCPRALSNNKIINCRYTCFPACETASVGNLVGAANSCFHDAWGFGDAGETWSLYDDVELFLYECRNNCGCGDDFNATDTCISCNLVTSSRLQFGGTCSDSFGCLEILGPTDVCCPLAMKAGGYDCMLNSANNCDPSDTSIIPAELFPGNCDDSTCPLYGFCDWNPENNGRCSFTQTSRGNTGTFPGGCSKSPACDSRPSQSSSAVSTKREPFMSEDDDEQDWQEMAEIIGQYVVPVVLGAIGAITFCLRVYRTNKLLLIGTSEELENVKVESVTSPFSKSTPEREEHDGSVGANTEPSESVGPSILASQASRLEVGADVTPSGLIWVERDYLGMHDNDEDVAECTAVSPVNMVYISPDGMTGTTPEHLSAQLEAGRGFASFGGAILCNFTSSNVEATELLRSQAEIDDKTEGAPIPCWAELFSISSRSGEDGVQLKTLVLPEYDSMFSDFQYDGRERMSWRSLGDNVSIVCVFVPSSRWWLPRLRGKVAKWNGEEMDGSPVPFDLSVSRMGNSRFKVKDKYQTIAGTADASSGGVALLAVLLCALEGGCTSRMTVAELNWQGGKHENGELISVHGIQGKSL